MVDPGGYVDVNIFVYWLSSHPTLGIRSYEWLKKIEGASRGKYTTSALTLYQITVIIAGLTGKKPKGPRIGRGGSKFDRGLSGLRIMRLTMEDLIEAAKLMKEYSLDYEDAIHLASALRSRAKEIDSTTRTSTELH